MCPQTKKTLLRYRVFFIPEIPLIYRSFYVKLEKLLFKVLNTLATIGPSNIKEAITTIAIKTRISAYSTRPCPFSFGANNTAFLLVIGFERWHFDKSATCHLKMEALLKQGLFFEARASLRKAGEAVIDGAEHVANDGAK